MDSSKNRTWLEIEDVMALSLTDPDRDIWCISDDGSYDFISTAKEIADVVRRGEPLSPNIKYAYINNSNTTEVEGELEKIEIGTKSEDLQLKEVRYKIKTFLSRNISKVENDINQFLDDANDKSILNINIQSSGGDVPYWVGIIYYSYNKEV